ncbi:MAG: hypothetical protein R2798_01220 [Chitinophagales bacterium]|nr:hypothetical protein [Bacteroidota bacterium]MCB9042976.1 hypothetical protein [Chitinophagales bacterium]
MKLFILIFFSTISLSAQKLVLLNQVQDSISFRGISVVDENIFWLAGSKGVIGKTTNGGQTFAWYYLPNYQQNEFRDIEATSEKAAWVMAITQAAEIIVTSDGGETFQTAYTDTREKAFLDALDCNAQHCVAIGDAVDKKQFYLLENKDNIWQLNTHSGLEMREGEAFFAASGSNIKALGEQDFIVVSGGKTARLLYRYKGKTKAQKLPLVQGKETTGANGFDYLAEQQKGIVVGGDFNEPKLSEGNMVLFRWNEKRRRFDFALPQQNAEGYKSGVAFLNENIVVACGTSGIDYSTDGGQHWTHFSDDAFHAIAPLDAHSLVLVGPKGKVAKLVF